VGICDGTEGPTFPGAAGSESSIAWCHGVRRHVAAPFRFLAGKLRAYDGAPRLAASGKRYGRALRTRSLVRPLRAGAMKPARFGTIVVTGGAGFIGSCVVRQLLQETDAIVVNVDKLTYAGNLESLPGVEKHPRYRFEHVDICDTEAVARVYREHRPDAVMHLAAETHVDRSIAGPGAFVATNVVGTFVLLEAAYSYWQTLPAGRKERFRFHHISTDEVYGSLDEAGCFT